MILLVLLIGMMIPLYTMAYARTFRAVNASRRAGCEYGSSCDFECAHWVLAFLAGSAWPLVALFHPEHVFPHRGDRDVRRMAKEVAFERNRLERDKMFSRHRAELEQIARERVELEERETRRIQSTIN